MILPPSDLLNASLCFEYTNEHQGLHSKYGRVFVYRQNISKCVTPSMCRFAPQMMTLGYVTGGESWISDDKKSTWHKYAVGDLVTLNPWDSFRQIVKEPFTWILLHFDRSLLVNKFSQATIFPAQKGESDVVSSLVGTIFEKSMSAPASQSADKFEDVLIELVGDELCIQLNSEDENLLAQFESIRKEVHSQYSDSNFSIKNLVEPGRSRSVLYKIFDVHTAMSPKAFLDSVRLGYAYPMIQEGRPIKEVAHKTGFKRSDRLAELLKKMIGITPSEI